MLRAFTHAACLSHFVPRGFPECPERLSGILDALGRDEIEIDLVSFPDMDAAEGASPEVAAPAEIGVPPASRAAVEAVSRLHSAEYLQRLHDAVVTGRPVVDSPDNPLSRGTWEAAWGAVEAGVAAADWMMDGTGRRAFLAARPPGHHAERDRAMGFCYLGTAAAIAQHLLSHASIERVAVFDFDVHHGNGTQHLMEERADVLYVSVHQWPFYPGTGAATETGRGAGVGATLNVPLPAGSGDRAYWRAMDETILPALVDFAPGALVLSAGFDAWQGDPLAGMRLSRAGFIGLGSRLHSFAEAHCGGRAVAVLEGGYDLAALPSLVVAHLRALDGAPGDAVGGPGKARPT